jgi:hypothetical protein
MVEARSIRGIAPGDQHRRAGVRCEGATPQPARPRPSHAPESVRKPERDGGERNPKHSLCKPPGQFRAYAPELNNFSAMGGTITPT